MDIWKFFDITHKRHTICNPICETKLQKLVDYLQLPKDAKVIDIATGKGEFLVRLAEKYDINGIGIDISPYCIEDCTQKANNRILNAKLEFVHMGGAEFTKDHDEKYDLASCIGACWIYKDIRGTLLELKRLVVHGGWIVVAEAFWRKEPSDEYLNASKDSKDSFTTLKENASVGEEIGLNLVHTFISNQDDWDTYEGLQWLATDDYIRQNPDDADNTELLKKVSTAKDVYLNKGGRETLGFAVYLYRSID